MNLVVIIGARRYFKFTLILAGRLTVRKFNECVAQLNKIYQDKKRILSIPQSKMSKSERDIYWEHREASSAEVEGKVYLLEQDLRAHSWSKSSFVNNATGRAVIAILRHLGRIREVRGGGKNKVKIVLN